ncbi:MAG TPA: hypothetical protein VLA45_19300 [Paracoccaceae bacterium]|nr:hypothetical protein [Paracoccaceae bacterium]
MEQERIVRAMARIEAAASRIEAAAARPLVSRPPAIPSPSDHTLADRELADKHERLRQEAWAALAEIDSLIETLDA